jgi:Tol biopolymer transport system component
MTSSSSRITTDGAPDVIGRTLGHYRIASRLGQGGMGEVYLAEDTRLHREVALKLLPAELAGDPERRRRFEREAQAVAALNHPNIVVVHSVEEAEGVPFLTMELVEGRALSELIPKDGLPLGRFLELAVPLADAISAVHSRGITHRDLKPENVMVTGEGRVKVLDFGLAKRMEGAPVGEGASGLPPATTTEPGRILGTVPYMSPEQAQGKAVDHRSDVFSLGAVLYLMATGRRPFEGDDPASILSSVLKDTPPPVTELRPALPRDLGRIVRHCLHKDPERRYQTAKDIRNELEELKKEVDSGALQLPAAERARQPLVTIAVVAGLGVLVLGISIWALFFRGEAPEAARETRPVTTLEGWESGPTWFGSLIAYSKPGPEGDDIYFTTSSGGDPVRLTRSPPSHWDPRWSPDGRYIAYLSDRGADMALCLMISSGGSERELARSDPNLGAMPWSPDGKELLFTRGGALWKVDIATYKETPLTDPAVGGSSASWSPDGRWIAFTRRQDGRPGLWLLPSQGGEPLELLVDQHSNDEPAWSEDSRRVVFTSIRPGPSKDLWEIEVSSRSLRRLTAGRADDGEPTVAGDGRIAYVEGRENADLYICTVADGSHDKITAYSAGSYFPRFAPDRPRLVYVSSQSGDAELWMLDLTTRTERQLTFDLRWSGPPDWSPDGSRIVFVSNRDGAPRLWLLDADVGAPHLLMDRIVSYAEMLPRWSPDGRTIVFFSGEDEVWAVDSDGENPRRLLSEVLQGGRRERFSSGFDWYQDSRRAVYSRPASDGSREEELVVRDLENGPEAVLYRGNHAEPIVSPDGRMVAFCRGRHAQQELCIMRLRQPDSPDGLPERIGDPQQLTDGRSAWHVHNGGWSPDGTRIAYTRVEAESDIVVIENDR